jgi:aryl-alcohol dehydrogenase-like predicted oxidoreductase
MLTRPLGPNLPAVTIVGYGGMHLSLDSRPPEDVGVKVVHAALDAGETLIDTANVYCLDQNDIGHNERLIARALREWRGNRENVLVATKGGLVRPTGRWDRDARPEQLRQACDRSLKALGVEQIALYQLHAVDPAVPLEESLGAMVDLQKAGKIRAIGLSNVSVEEIKRGERVTTISTVQNRLNPFFREAIREGVIDYCATRGIGFLAYSPTGGARLTKETAQSPGAAADRPPLNSTPHQGHHRVGCCPGSDGVCHPEFENRRACTGQRQGRRPDALPGRHQRHRPRRLRQVVAKTGDGEGTALKSQGT